MRYPTRMPILYHQPNWDRGPLASAFEDPKVEQAVPGRSETLPASFPKEDQRRDATYDEFDGPHQFLDRPSTQTGILGEHDLPRAETHLLAQEQDIVLGKINDRLSQCAFDFVAKYQFPIPLEQDKRPIRIASDREWNEWVFLLKRRSWPAFCLNTSTLMTC